MIVYFGNTLNKHQSNVADVLYELTNGDYVYVETVPPRVDNTHGGKLKVERPYVLAAYQDKLLAKEAHRLAREADVVLFGAESFCFEMERMSLKHPGLAFEVSERWLKRGWLNIFSPRLLRNIWCYHTRGWKNKPLYKLCSSAYGAGDQYRLHTFKHRCFKWGYFTEVDENEVEAPLGVSTSKRATIMWCARFLKLKHPELVIALARKLKDSGYDVRIDMYGDGEEKDRIALMRDGLHVEDIVSLKGSVSNGEVLRAMREHDIFLFTSDRREGWGAVLNEAMSNGCAIVASDAIGSVPFLITNNENGLIFRSNDIASLYEKTVYLLEDSYKRQQMAHQAYKTMRELWSPQKAAENLLKLVNDLNNERQSSILEGPCSKAVPFKG